MECKKPTRKYPQGRTGTIAGKQAHYKVGEEACDQCQQAVRNYNRERHVWKSPKPTGEELMECEKATSHNPEGRTGTAAGYNAHRRAGEEPCESCRAGVRESRMWAGVQEILRGDTCSTPTRKFPEGRTGLYAGFTFHKRVGEEPCESCQEAGRAYSRQAYQKYYRKNRQDVLVKNMRRKAQERDWRHIPYTAKEMTEAFGTTCYLCEHPVDLQSESGKPLSASIDHVVPLHMLDGPGDQLSNVRWTHLRCNLRKRHRTVGQCSLPFPKPRGDEF